MDDTAHDPQQKINAVADNEYGDRQQDTDASPAGRFRRQSIKGNSQLSTRQP